MGYKVEKIYEVLHFKETNRGYLNHMWAKIKAEYSKDLWDTEKVAYKEMYEKIGVYLDSEIMKKNLGMKATAKLLCIDSLWRGVNDRETTESNSSGCNVQCRSKGIMGLTLE